MSSLERLTAHEFLARDEQSSVALDAETLAAAAAIVEDVRARGREAVLEHALRLGDLEAGAPWILAGDALAAERDALPAEERALLERTAARIEAFATAQKECLGELETDVPGGRAGHAIAPVAAAGCYAPGGRFPLPSSVLMTAVTARVAGVERVWVASPRPTRLTRAAASIAGADGLLCVGGAQAIAALAFGAGELPRADVVVGPGNRWVTAAKKLVAGECGIDMLAGPSELLVLADAEADPRLVALDLLAQAEHDPDARPLLVSDSVELLDAVDAELERQLADLPTRDIARAAVSTGGRAVLCADLDEAARVANRIAPEHLEVLTRAPRELAAKLRHFGALFLGAGAAEVFGDYGAGPNHVLPTGGVARHAGGLSVFTFLRVRTWMELDHVPAGLEADVAQLARLEGLEGHARAAEGR